MRCNFLIRFVASISMAASSSLFAAQPAPVPVGVAVVDITPDYPIRMLGYESRKTESEGVASRLKARALAIGGDDAAEGGPAVLVAVDNCAVGAKVVEEVAARLKKKVKLPRERFVVCSTHTHCAPALNSEIAFIFGDRVARCRAVAYRALHSRADRCAGEGCPSRAGRPVPATLAWGKGRTGFAANRRVLKNGRWVNFGVNPNGPVDHSVPVLRATDAGGKVKAVLFGYACHCTTLGGDFNKICASGPDMHVTKLNSSLRVRSRWRSLVAGPTPILSLAATWMMRSSMDCPPVAR